MWEVIRHLYRDKTLAFLTVFRIVFQRHHYLYPMVHLSIKTAAEREIHCRFPRNGEKTLLNTFHLRIYQALQATLKD